MTISKITEPTSISSFTLATGETLEVYNAQYRVIPKPVGLEDLGTADVWHEGTKSYYRAKLLKKLTPEEVNFDPAG